MGGLGTLSISRASFSSSPQCFLFVFSAMPPGLLMPTCSFGTFCLIRTIEKSLVLFPIYLQAGLPATLRVSNTVACHFHGKSWVRSGRRIHLHCPINNHVWTACLRGATTVLHNAHFAPHEAFDCAVSETVYRRPVAFDWQATMPLRAAVWFCPPALGGKGLTSLFAVQL